MEKVCKSNLLLCSFGCEWHALVAAWLDTDLISEYCLLWKQKKESNFRIRRLQDSFLFFVPWSTHANATRSNHQIFLVTLWWGNILFRKTIGRGDFLRMWEKKKTIDSSSGLCNRIWECLFRKLFFQALPITVSRIRAFQSCQGGGGKINDFQRRTKVHNRFCFAKSMPQTNNLVRETLRIIPLLCDVCFDEWDLKFEAAGGDRRWVLGLLIGHRLGMVFTKCPPYFEKSGVNDFLKAIRAFQMSCNLIKNAKKYW